MGPENVVKPFNALLFKVVYNQVPVIVVSAVNQDVLVGRKLEQNCIGLAYINEVNFEQAV
ncbi:MAG: hypothetical protein H0Z35_07810 [Thermoanaerobacteraceae bacterium]|nr:hypothetical protein [Thermoanaerobacteraceae bacterium]